MSLLFAVPAPISPSGTSFLVCSSERSPNEGQGILRLPHLPVQETIELLHTEIAVDHIREECIIGKPFDQWGAEMGMNVYGLSMAVTTVVTRYRSEKEPQKGLTGQEMLRLVLGTENNAASAVQKLISLQQEHGLGNDSGIVTGGHEHGYSFLLADTAGCWAVEMADKMWVSKKLDAFHAVAGAFSLEEDFDQSSDGIEENARNLKWVKKNKPFNFRLAYGLRKVARQSKAEQRTALLHDYWKGHASTFGRENAMAVLQMQLPSGKAFHPAKVRMASLEQYATGGSNPWQTVNSMVAEIRPTWPHLCWLTGTSAPSLSIFKPFMLPGNNIMEGLFKAPSQLINDSLWWKAETFHRAVMVNYQASLDRFAAEREELQQRFIKLTESMLPTLPTPEQWNELSQDCLRLHLKKMLEWGYSLKKNPAPQKQFSPFYKKYVQRLTEKVKPLIR